MTELLKRLDGKYVIEKLDGDCQTCDTLSQAKAPGRSGLLNPAPDEFGASFATEVLWIKHLGCLLDSPVLEVGANIKQHRGAADELSNSRARQGNRTGRRA